MKGGQCMQLIEDLTPKKRKEALARDIAIATILISGYRIWIALFGEEELLATANFVGTYILGPIAPLMALALVGYILWYYAVYVPKKAFAILWRKR